MEREGNLYLKYALGLLYNWAQFCGNSRLRGVTLGGGPGASAGW